MRGCSRQRFLQDCTHVVVWHLAGASGAEDTTTRTAVMLTIKDGENHITFEALCAFINSKKEEKLVALVGTNWSVKKQYRPQQSSLNA